MYLFGVRKTGVIVHENKGQPMYSITYTHRLTRLPSNGRVKSSPASYAAYLSFPNPKLGGYDHPRTSKDVRSVCTPPASRTVA
jgi:hypothetical protein